MGKTGPQPTNLININLPTKCVCLGVSFSSDTEAFAKDNFEKKLVALEECLISSSRAVKIPFLSFTCEDIGVAMVTNRLANYKRASQSGARAVLLKFHSKTASRCEDGTVTGDFLDELSNFHVDTFSELEKHSGRFSEVSESDVEKFFEGIENANTKNITFYDLKLVKKFLVEERHEIREIEKIPPTELDSYLSQFVLAARTKTGKDFEPSSLRGILAS